MTSFITNYLSSGITSRKEQDNSPIAKQGAVSPISADYSLNMDKCVLKKIECSERDTKLVTQYKVGNLVFTLQAGYYELVRAGLDKLYTSQNISYTPILDKQGYESARTYRVTRKGNSRFTVNLYHTKCRILVNGANELEFINYDLTVITKYIDQNFSEECNTLNTLIRNTMYLMRNPKKSDTDNIESTEKPKCSVCNRNVHSRASQCSTCWKYVHYNCDKLDKDVIRDIVNPDNMYVYRCVKCSQHATLDENAIELTH